MEKFSASDGKELVYLRFDPKDSPKAVVLVGHGMNDHKERFIPLAEALTSIGASCWIPDLRGHGDTDPDVNKGYLADTNGFERVVQDLIELGDYASKSFGGLPLFYFGHSFGALLGFALIATNGKYLEGAVLSAPPKRQTPVMDKLGGWVVDLGGAMKGLHAPARLPNQMSFGQYAKTVPHARTRFDWLTRDSSVVDAYIADPKCNFICTYGFYRDLIHGLRKVYSEGFLESVPPTLPLFLFCGSADPVIGMREGYERLTQEFKLLGIIDFESQCYEGDRHESLNEINREEVLDNIVDWFSRHIR
jgi:alpha-beta hydrolase superfamily lysophospholipase